jgi:IMP dehydrogenase
MPQPKFREMVRTYGFDEVALVPGDITINPDQTDISFALGNLTFSTPILASAMDAVVNPLFAIKFSKLGGLAVLNLEGIQARYENSAIASDAGADVLVVQSTITTARHISKSYRGLVLPELCQMTSLPTIVGNCCSYSSALELMRTGINAVLVGVGPGAACTTREVIGVGVPQVTATIECAAARERHLKETGKYVSVITDGGIRTGGDLCKAFAAGADAVMLGSPLAQAIEAPGRGYHWGMSHPHPALPRGTRIRVGTSAPLEQILFGPTSVTDGTQNLLGALHTSMGVCGARTIKEMHNVKMIIAPSIKTEGKYFQATQSIP